MGKRTAIQPEKVDDMRAFGTGGPIAVLEERIGAEMRAASAEGWTLGDGWGLGNAEERMCCALGAPVRDVLARRGKRDRSRMVTLAARVCRSRLGIPRDVYVDIASGFDGETFDPNTDEHVHLGRRLRELADELNAARVRA